MQGDGTTLVLWDNIADVEVNAELHVVLDANLGSALTIGVVFENQIVAPANAAPDNSVAWISANSKGSAHPQAININMKALASTADEQATGAARVSFAPRPERIRVRRATQP